MIGVVGDLQINYIANDNEYVEIFKITEISNFRLKNYSEIQFNVDEVYYIEDTVYGVSVSVDIEDKGDDNCFQVTTGRVTEFSLPQYNIAGTMKLKFF